MEHHFSIEESLKFGWEKTKKHSRLLFMALITLFAIQIAGSVCARVLHGTFEGVLASLLISIIGLVIGVGLTVIVLKIARGQHATYEDLIPSMELVWRYFVTSLFVGLIVFVGLILLIIPGIYLALRYSMVRFAIVDGAGITDSLSLSAKMTQGIKWKLLGFMVVIIVLNIIGALLLGVGLLLSIPVTTIAFAQVYTKLHAHHHKAS